jgi:hypothetical protein
MSRKWMVALVTISAATSILNLAMLVGQSSGPAIARGAGAGSKLLEDEDFTAALAKLVRKTVRDYCTVGKRNGIDC